MQIVRTTDTAIPMNAYQVTDVYKSLFRIATLYFLDLISIQFRLETILFLQIHVQQIHVQMTDLA